MRGLVQPEVPPSLVRLAFMLRATRAPLTQEALARKMGCSSRTVMRAERGDKLPTATLINLWLASADATEEERATVRALYAKACEEARQNRAATASPVPTATLEEFIPGRTESEEADMHRAAVLKGMVAGGAALLLSRSSSPAVPVISPDESVAEAMKTVTGQYRRLEATMPVGDLLTPVRSHLRLISRTLGLWPNGTDRKTLAAAASEAAGLAGWLAMDLDDHDAARTHYRAAIGFATQTRSGPLRAYMLGSMAAWAAGCGLGAEALRLTQAAWPFVIVGEQPTARAWLAATEAVAYATAGNQHAALAALDHADAVISTDSGIPRWPWMYTFGHDKVDRYRATCYTKLKLPNLAGPALQHALDSLPLTATKQRALLLADLAEVAFMQEDVDRSVALLTDAFTIGIAVGSRRIVERVRDIRLELTPWETAAAVQALDRHLLATLLRRPASSP